MSFSCDVWLGLADISQERVQQRTAELEMSKKSAEAANESKVGATLSNDVGFACIALTTRLQTLFIANISHELKTPLKLVHPHLIIAVFPLTMIEAAFLA